ncbi:MAG: CPBP family intramembrane metalloprotease [Butyrivibrio sp.]|nr:CPBP family intramembrane metalloprotease [Butyrivibrio sp.]
MNAKKANLLFLVIILLTYALIIIINMLYIVDGWVPSIAINNLLSEMTSLLPSLAFIFLTGESVFLSRDREAIVPMRRLRIPTVLLILLILMMLFPAIALCNAISMLFVENTVLTISGQVLSEPMWKMLLSIGLFGPFVEEFVFRGVFFHSYRRSGRVLGSAILSGVCFGLMHMNLNQAAYAFFIGLMFALIVEATGSVLATFIAHAVFNSFEVCMMYAEETLMGGGISAAQELLSGDGGRSQMLLMIPSLIGPAVIFTGIAILLIYLCAVLEGREEQFKRLFQKTDAPKPALVTPSLIIAFVLAGLYMVFQAIATALQL